MAYLPLSTANLPDPAIDPAQGSSPADYFDVALYTGNGTSTEVSTLSFQPDFVWGKKRSTAGSHFLLDAIRGVNSTLSSDTTGAEDTSTDIFTSFDSDGFTVGANGQSNSNGVTYVAWNWKANGSGVSNNVGTIPSTVSANTTSGFSIVSYVSNGTNTGSVGHGLNQKPDIVIQKNRDTASDWLVLTDLVDGSNDYLLLNSTAAAASAAGGANATTFVSWDRPSGDDMICYAFHSVEGFSKFGSYVANNNTDGPFLYCGFRPAFLMVKRANNAGAPWSIIDNARNTYNQVNLELDANSSGAEFNINNGADFVSNGVKLRDSAYLNSSNGNTFIYMAFAENPFKYSNAR